MPDTKTVLLYCDGASRGNPGPASVGAVLYDCEPMTDENLGGGMAPHKVLAEVSESIGPATNNHAEYAALIAGLKKARAMKVYDIKIRMDSELVVKQIRREYRVKKESLRPLFVAATALLSEFRSWQIHHIPRDQNKEADRLANMALDQAST